jgi:hypothetical protein
MTDMKFFCGYVIVLAAAMAMPAFAGGKDDFPLNVHVVGMDTKQGAPSGPDMLTPLPYHTFTVHTDGDRREFTLVRQISFTHRLDILELGDHKGRWNKNGSLEIQFLDRNGKLKHASYDIVREVLK